MTFEQNAAVSPYDAERRRAKVQFFLIYTLLLLFLPFPPSPAPGIIPLVLSIVSLLALGAYLSGAVTRNELHRSGTNDKHRR